MEVVLFVQGRLYVSIFGYVTCTTVDAFSAIRGTSFCGLRDLAELELVEVFLAFVGCFENARI
jgi:hypothetical protein